jgi:uncharacterized protein (DUF58 family)
LNSSITLKLTHYSVKNSVQLYTRQSLMNVKSMTLLAAASFLLVAAVLQSNPGQLHFMAGSIIAIALVAFIAVRISVRGLRCQRQVSDRIYEDDWISVSLVIMNPSHWPKFFVAIEETFSPWLQVENARFLLPVIWPGQRINIEYRALASKRGKLPIGPLQIAATDPIGLYFRTRKLADMSYAIVYPRPIEVPTLDLTGAANFGIGIAERMARTGEGSDYHGVRDYHPGDELRRIHWKATARHQRLSVIEFQQAYTADVVIALDLLTGTDIGEGKETTLEYGVKIAASIARRALDNGAIVTLALCGADGLQTALCRKDDEFQQILELLALAQADGEMPIYTLLERISPLLTPGVAAVAITAAPDSRLTGMARVLDGESVSLVAVLLDALTFAGREEFIPGKPGTETKLGSLQAANPFAAEAESLRQIGASAHLVIKGEDLTQTVRRIMGGAEHVV